MKPVLSERLAEAIDQAGTDGESLFLARLCLLLGAELGDVTRFTNAVTAALGARADEPPR